MARHLLPVKLVPSPTQRRGAHLEDLAERVLRERGLVIVERNWRGGGGEIDRVGWDGDVLCFVEVRSRAHDDWGTAEESVDPRKRSKLIRAARAYLTRFPRNDEPPVRFDVVGITFGLSDEDEAEVRVIEGAFDGTGRPL